MSSYFDTMGRCVADPAAVAELVKAQYRHYLRGLLDECLVAEREKVYDFLRRLDRIELPDPLGPRMAVEQIHNLAHDVGRAQIHLKGQRRAGDNPRIAVS